MAKSVSSQTIDIFVGDEVFTCDRALLSQKSAFFKTLLDSEMKEMSEGVIVVDGIAPTVFKDLLHWMQNGTDIFNEGNNFDLIVAANQLLIQDLLKIGEDYLVSKVSLENCVYHYKLSYSFGSPMPCLMKASLDTMAYNFDKVSSSELNELSPEAFKQLLRHQNLETCSEDVAVEKILHWVRGCPRSGQSTSRPSESREKYLLELLQSSRYLLVSTNFLWETLASDRLVHSDPKCRDLVEEIVRYKTQVDSHQYYCPSPALLRDSRASRDYRNVILYLNRDDGLTYALDPFDKHWRGFRKVTPDGLHSWNSSAIANLNDVIYALNYLTCHFPKNIEYYCHLDEYGRTFTFIDFPNKGTAEAFLPVEEELVVVNTDKENNYTVECLTPTRAPSLCWRRVGKLQGRGKLARATNVGFYLVVFWNELDNLFIETFNIQTGEAFVVKDTLSDVSSMVTFKTQNQVFVLGGNGWLFRLETSREGPYVKLVRVKQLWEGRHRLLGAVLFGDVLYVLGDIKFSDIQWCESPGLDGVFREVRASSHSGNIGYVILGILDSRSITRNEH